VKTKAEAAIARARDEVEPASFRHEVLSAAQRFKSSWVELGSVLVRVRDEGLFDGWGFASFEAYCAKELRIKKQTALKLTSSYAFLARHEKALLDGRVESGGPKAARVPAFEVISVLAGAEERGLLNDGDYREMREEIWGGERPAASVVRDLASRFPQPPPPEPPADLVVRRLAHAARKLASDLRACRRVPAAVAERAVALAEDVEELASKE
jgi:hypothetical protein